MRIAADTGGTFTDVVFEDDQGQLTLSKASTTPADPISGVLDAVAVAAQEQSMPLKQFLGKIKTFIHGTTHALNAVITGNTAKTAFITTQGHGDILVYREGGRREPFNQTVSYPEPYIPRSLSFEVEERIASDGSVVLPLNEESVLTIIDQLKELEVEAVAVCLLWSPVEQKHEQRIGQLLLQHLPGVPFTLSSQLNPILREYRRASAAAIDASLKPLMMRYIGDLTQRLTDLGFSGSVQILTSFGGVKMADEIARAPIQLLQSGPSMAPVAGRFYGCEDNDSKVNVSKDGAGKDLIITDAGGTTYDVSLVRENEIIKTREYWIGEKFFGHVTGFPSVEVRSVGAGGGSIAWVDPGGVLHVGPQSQGADPGPACYKRGGTEATVTDAAVILGYIDPEYFLGGRLKLDRSASVAAAQKQVGEKLGLNVEECAQSIMALATENMVQAIFDLSVERGIEPANATMIGGGGAAGFNAVFIARRLDCRKVIFPSVGAVLSAAGAILSDMVGLYGKAAFVSSQDFNREVANAALAGLRQECHDFAKSVGVPLERSQIKYSVEARYKGQVWDIEVPLRGGEFRDDSDLVNLVDDFHVTHQRIFAVCDPDSPIEILTWNAAISCRSDSPATGELSAEHQHSRSKESRRIHLPQAGFTEAAIIDFNSMDVDTVLHGPAIVESPFTCAQNE